jgi:hypothetical protein
MFASKTKTYVDDEIRRMMIVLQEKSPDSKEYGETLEQLQKLHKIRQDEKPDRVSADAKFQGAVSILGIVTILQYEHLHPIASKAMSFIKLR